MIWVFSRAREFLDLTVLKCVHSMIETSFLKAMNAPEKRKHVLPQKASPSFK